MEQYYTVEQVAELLHMHPKTIQRYIREGKLQAKKVGKSWRIFEYALKAYMESFDAEGTDLPKEQSRALVSSVIDIQVQNFAEASALEKFLIAAVNSKPNELGKTTMHIQYLEYENILRVTLWGNISFMQKMFEVLSGVVEQEEGDGYDDKDNREK